LSKIICSKPLSKAGILSSHPDNTILVEVGKLRVLSDLVGRHPPADELVAHRAFVLLQMIYPVLGAIRHRQTNVFC
jgi:hypothetical protein